MFCSTSAQVDIIQLDDAITCRCGKILPKKNSFSVYDKRFCSMNCLRPYKEAEDEKRKPKNVTPINLIPTYGGPAAY